MEILISNWLADLNGRNQNTYKFALQLAILDNCDKEQLSYKEIATSFAERYWNNVVAYNLRESININKAPYFHKAIADIASEYNLEGLYYNQALKKEKKLSPLIVDKLVGGYKTTLQNPISRLQADSDSKRSGTGSKKGSGWLYSWDSSQELVMLNRKSLEKIFVHKEVLRKLTVFHWALFIERYNQAPSVTNKLLDAKKSRAIKKLVRELVIGLSDDRCFYCEQIPNTVEIDHFIPFAFLFDNPIWDLVYSCGDCNSGKGGKFEKLPPKEYVSKLFQRNKVMFSEDPNIFEGFDELEVLENYIHKTYESCSNAGFGYWEQIAKETVQKKVPKFGLN